MGKILKKKFGVKQIIGENRNLICSECGHRAGLHYDNDCPKISKNTHLLNWVKNRRET